jgi:hypothetical protein
MIALIASDFKPPAACLHGAHVLRARAAVEAEHGNSPTSSNSRPLIDNDPPQTIGRLTIVA